MLAAPPLRILALLEANSISGTAKAVLEMAYEAQASNGELEIAVANFIRGDASTKNSLTNALQEAQIPCFFIREKGRFDKSVMPRIRQIAREWTANVVWTNSVKSHFLVHRAKLNKPCKWLAFHHGYTSTDFKMQLYNQLDRISLRHADRVVTVCLLFAEQMKARGVPPSRIRVQHMPIRHFANSAEDAAALRAELHLPPETKVILSIGRLSHEKGHRDLITAFLQLCEEMTNLHLVIVGEGPERAKLDRGHKHISFVGQRDDAKRFYAIADVFALPSYTEGTPNVLLESMAAGVPVVATSVGGVPELATDKRNALLVPAADPSEMAKALRTILQSPALRNELVATANQVVEAHSPRAYFEAMRKVFQEAVE